MGMKHILNAMNGVCFFIYLKTGDLLQRKQVHVWQTVWVDPGQTDGQGRFFLRSLSVYFMCYSHIQI